MKAIGKTAAEAARKPIMARLIAAACCAVCLCFALVACNGDGAMREQLAGTWDYDDETLVRFVGSELTDQQMQAARQLAFLNLGEDGSAEFVLLGDSRSGTWEVDDSDIAISIDGDSVSATLEEGVLAIGEGATRISFEKASEPRAIPSANERAAAMETLIGKDVIEGMGDALANLGVTPQAQLTSLTEPVQVSDDDVASIAVMGFGINELGDPGYSLRVANNADADIRVVFRGFAVGGAAVTAYGSTVLEPGQTDDAFLAFDAADLEGQSSPDALADVWGTIAVYDDATMSELSAYDFAM